MILEFIINIFSFGVDRILQLLSLLPDMPAVIVTIAESSYQFLGFGFGFLYKLLGKELALAMMGTVLTYLVFSNGWKLLNWSYTKIRG